MRSDFDRERRSCTARVACVRRASTSCAAAATRSKPSSTPSTCWSWTEPTYAGNRSRRARRPWRASCRWPKDKITLRNRARVIVGGISRLKSRSGRHFRARRSLLASVLCPILVPACSADVALIPHTEKDRVGSKFVDDVNRPRVRRRPFDLSHAAMAGSSSMA